MTCLVVYEGSLYVFEPSPVVFHLLIVLSPLPMFDQFAKSDVVSGLHLCAWVLQESEYLRQHDGYDGEVHE